MKLFLKFAVIAVLAFSQLYAQDKKHNLEPMASVELALQPYLKYETDNYKREILEIVNRLPNTQKEKLGVLPSTINFYQLYNLENKNQSKLVKILIKKLAEKENRELLSTTIKASYGSIFNDNVLLDESLDFNPENKEEITRTSQVKSLMNDDRFLELIKENPRLTEVRWGGNRFQDISGKVIEGVFDENIEKKVEFLNAKVRANFNKRIENATDKQIQKLIDDIDADKIIYENTSGKAKFTKVDGQYIIRTVTNESSTVFMDLPNELYQDFNKLEKFARSAHAQQFLGRQFHTSGSSKVGIRAKGKTKFKRAMSRWKSAFKRAVKNPGRDDIVFILRDKSGEIRQLFHSKKPRVFDIDFWKGLKKAYYVVPQKGQFVLGAITGVAQFLSTVTAISVFGDVGELSHKSAVLSFIYATVIGTMYGTYKNLIDGGTQTAQFWKKFIIVTISYNYFLFFWKDMPLDLFGPEAVEALQNHLKVFSYASLSNLASQNWKQFSIGRKLARQTTALLNTRFNIFKGLKKSDVQDPAFHLIHNTIKNVTLEGADSSPLFNIGPVSINISHVFLTFSIPIARVISYVLLRHKKAHLATQKAKDLMDKLILKSWWQKKTCDSNYEN